jgi:hypothetical protein
MAEESERFVSTVDALAYLDVPIGDMSELEEFCTRNDAGGRALQAVILAVANKLARLEDRLAG